MSVFVNAWIPLAALALLACRAPQHPEADAAWRGGLERWHAERAEEIAGKDGWLTLVTRSWLPEGASRIGSDPGSDVVLPSDHAPAEVGTVVRAGNELRFVAAKGSHVTVDGAARTELPIVDDHDGHPTVWALGSLTFRVIRRQDRFALRVKDSESPARAAFPGLTYYAPDARWRLHARLERAPAGKTVRIVNVLGQEEDMPTPGTLVFAVDGHDYRLDTVTDRDEPGLFVLFKDRTSRSGTYPSGRFLYTSAPAADGSVEVDFNRAFNPPCAFTSHATCPLAPAQNALPLAIEVGERYRGHGDM